LADRGEFDLDRPLFAMLEYPRLAHDERYQRITARMVLSHGAGLPNWGGEKLTLGFNPGTAYGYSGEGFVFLEKALERVTGHSLDELARREAFQPLGMTRSSFVWQERFAGTAPHAKDWLWNVAPVNRYAEASAAFSLLTTATDYAKFVAAVLTGRGLSPTMWREFLTPVRESSPGRYVGLGIRVEDGPAGRRFYHSGSNGRRFTSYMSGDIEQISTDTTIRAYSPRGQCSARRWKAVPTRRESSSARFARARLSGCPLTAPCSSGLSSPGEASPRSRSKCWRVPWATPRTPPAHIWHSAGHWSRLATSSRQSSRIGAPGRWKPKPATRNGRLNGRRTAWRPARRP
jgi:hypothetical protein